MGRYKVIPAKPMYIDAVLKNLSPEIKKELKALSNDPFNKLLRDNIKYADDSWIVIYDDRVLCMLGIGGATLLSDVGIPWLITTTHIKKHKKEFLKGTKVVLAYWLTKYNTLENYVPLDFKSSIRWLKWAGFTIFPPEPIGVGGQLIHKVVLRKK